MPETRLRSGQLAAAAGVNIETLRYYERRGLLPQPPRSLGGHHAARAVPADGPRVASARRDSSDAGLQARAAAKLAEVDRKLAELTSLRDTLRAAIAAGREDLIACAESSCCPLPFDDQTEE